ncbi:MAG: hypothetical protein ABJN84_03110 [Flavobacteriaceae bacterium]
MKKLKHSIIFVFLTCVISCQNSDSEIVASLNNEPITKSELKHWMLLGKANVYNYFYRKYDVQDREQFWIEKQGDEIPLEKLKKTALEVAKRYKIQQLLALQKGIVSTINFDEIMLDLEKVNAERKRKVEKGEPIYGPIQFTSRTYFSHVFDKMVIALKNELSKDELKPNNKQLKLLKEKSNKDMIGFLTMQYVDTNYKAYIDSLTVGSTVKIDKKVYEKIHIN